MPRGGNSTERGYGYRDHVLPRRQAQQLVDSGEAYCWRCGAWINPEQPWDFGHDDNDRALHRGPECRHCNRSTAATKGNRARGDTNHGNRSSRDW